MMKIVAKQISIEPYVTCLRDVRRKIRLKPYFQIEEIQDELNARVRQVNVSIWHQLYIKS